MNYKYNWKNVNNKKNKYQNHEKDNETSNEDFDQIILSIVYHPSLNKTRICKILSDACNLISNDQLLKTIFPLTVSECFQLRYRCGLSISDRTKSRLALKPNDSSNNLENNNIDHNNTRIINCKSSNCKTCIDGFDLVSQQPHWHCETISKKYKIKKYSCNNRFIIDDICCDKCDMYYIRSSIKQLRTRAGQHRRKMFMMCKQWGGSNITSSFFFDFRPLPPVPSSLIIISRPPPLL